MVRRPDTGTIPDAPGSYQFFDADGRVLYVGKAKSLRSRLSSYFGDPAAMAPKTAQMVAAADRVDWVEVENEAEAILLEYSLIKEHRPRFNIRLVDDKSYPWLMITAADKWPRAAVVRGSKRAGSRYFGPFAHVGALRETLDLVVRTFPIRTCSDGKLSTHQKLGKPCLLFHIDRCSGPCVDAVDQESYDGLVADVTSFFSGDTDDVAGRIEREKEAASERLDFERAALLRDQLKTLHQAVERQQVVSDPTDSFDMIGMVDESLEAAVSILHVRRGRIVGRRAFVLDKVEPAGMAAMVGYVLEELYGGVVSNPGRHRRQDVVEFGTGGRARLGPQSAGGGSSSFASGSHAAGLRPVSAARKGVASTARPGATGSERDGEDWASGASGVVPRGEARLADDKVPPVVLVPELPDEDDLDAYRQFLAMARGAPVLLKVPQRGAKKSLLETANRNAADELSRHRLRRASDHDSRSRAMADLQERLGLASAPLRIECYDMSHLQGTDYVGSMVVLEDGLPRPSEYRRFKIRDVPGNDDYAAMEEVLRRRLTNLLDARARRAEGIDNRAGRFAYPPQLLLVDGGKGQLGVAVKVLAELGLDSEIPVASLAKQLEEVFVPGRPAPVVLSRGSDALYLLQRIRDEAHRFAITYHRSLRGKRATAGVLDDVVGLGPGRRARLIRVFGSVAAVRRASLEDLVALGWLPDTVAVGVYAKLHPGQAGVREPLTGARAAGPPVSRNPGMADGLDQLGDNGDRSA